MKLKEFKSNIFFLISSVFLKFGMGWVYCNITSKRLGYEHFSFSPSWEWTFLSWSLFFLFAIPFSFMYQNRKQLISYEVLFILFYLSVIPFTTFVQYAGVSLRYIFLNCVYWFCLWGFVFGLGEISSDQKVILRRTLSINKREVIYLFLIFFIIVLYIFFANTSTKLNLSLMNVYELRSKFKQINLPIIIKYLFSWSRIIIAFLLGLCIYKKKWGWVIIASVCQLISFSIDGSKSTLFMMVSLIGLIILPYICLKRVNQLMIIGFLSIILTSFFMFVVFGNYSIPDLVIRRIFFLPIQLQTSYVDFFTNNPPDFFAQGIMRRLGAVSQYPTITNMIAEIYYDRPEMVANSGLISDAVMNLGISGIIIMPLVLSIVLKVADLVSKNLDVHIYAAVAFIIAILLLDGFLNTILLSHGLLPILFILLFMSRTYWGSQRNL